MSQQNGQWQQIASLLAKQQTWVVGGAIRDRLLDEQATDLDLIVGQGTPCLEPGYWQDKGVSAFWLDQERQMVRLVIAENANVDLAPMMGGDLATDLSMRDFTVNAMAIPLCGWLADDLSDIIDPCGGRDDLAARRLRLPQPDAVMSDPVRILRAARLLIDRQLMPDEATEIALSSSSVALSKASVERVWAEMEQILRHRQAATALDALKRWGAVRVLFPEVCAMTEVGQNQHHQYTVDVHSQLAFAAYVTVIQDGAHLSPDVASFVRRYWEELPQTEQSAIMLAGWLHDIGKPGSRTEQEGKVTFYGHEHLGATMATQIATRLRMSADQSRLLHTFITNHMYPMQLWRSGQLDLRLTHRLYRRTGRLGVAIILFTLADQLAKGEQVVDTAEFLAYRQAAEQMLLAYFCQYDQVVAPPPLLSGDEIVAELRQPRGPWVGEAKAALLEAQAAGHVCDRLQALDFIRQHQRTHRRNWRR